MNPSVVDAWLNGLTPLQLQGLEGELLTIDWFNNGSVPFLHINQHTWGLSKELLKQGAKHPDFLIFLDGDAFFIDCKAYKIPLDREGLFVGISNREAQKYAELERISGIPVWFAFVPPGQTIIGIFHLSEFSSKRAAVDNYPEMDGIHLTIREFKRRFSKR